MNTLHDVLWGQTNEELAYRLKLLGVTPRSPKKSDLIDALKASYAGSGLRAIWASLGELAQAAVAEACHSPGREFDETRIRARYGDLPSFCDLPESGRSFGYHHWNPKYATRLNLLFFSARHCRDRSIPSDLATRLSAFVPEPPEPTVPTLDEPGAEEGLSVRLTEPEAMAEVMALLRLAEQGHLQISAKTGMVSAPGCGKILECLSGGDFFPPEIACRVNRKSWEQEIGPIKPVAWARLLQCGRYVGRVGSKSRLTPAGIKALSLPSHELIRQLWTKWLANTAYDEFNRIEVIKGQHSKGHMTAKPPRRDAIADALAECPADQWVGLEQLSSYMVATGRVFDVSHDVGKLYLAEHRYGSLGYDGYGGWNIVQFRYLLCLLFEYAATLGLIDIAYVHPRDGLDDFREQWGADELEWLSRYDGLRALRVTKLGAYCLGRAAEYVPTHPASALELTVRPDLSIRVRSGSLLPSERLLLEAWAEPVEPACWRLEQGRAREAVERGQSAREFAGFLQRCDRQPLPERVEGFLRTCESDGRAVRSRGEAWLFECRDAGTAGMIAAQPGLRDLCHRCGDVHLAVPAAQLSKFRKLVRGLGLGVA